MIAFATEGLDMMAQVNNVVGITLQSAESWLQSLGRNNREEEMMDADDPREATAE
jgi:beta-lactam-binding protein with PASTA domain